MRSFLRPRLNSLDTFASTLLLALGVTPGLGCSEVVLENEGGGGGSPSTTGGPGATTTAAQTTAAQTTAAQTTAAQTTAAQTTAAQTTGTGGGTGGCVDPMPVLVNGMDTGLDLCEGGQYRRRSPVECPTGTNVDPCCGECPDGTVCSTQGEIACTCVPSCTNDLECGPGQLCMCGDPTGICVPASCTSAADCEAGQECTSWDETQGCLYYAFACTTAADTCGGDLDCVAPEPFCSVQPDGHRECVQGGCAIGRPFLVAGTARTATVARSSSWLGDAAPALGGLDPAIRAELAVAWTHVARMEHASIAAFARFSLQLLSLGAPVDLVERTNRAMADETKHARMAFSLASAYRGAPIGPGPLAIEGSLEADIDVRAIIELVIREGCVGETVAALEAAEAAERATDPVVRGVLSTIAEDESDHAELAYMTLRWALDAHGDAVRHVLAAEIGALEAELAHTTEPAPALDGPLIAHGVVTAAERAGLRGEAIRRAILPCLRALAEDCARRAA